MGTFAGIIAVVLLLAWLMLAGGGCSRNTSETPPAIAPPPVVLTEKMKSLDRAAVRAMLKHLTDTPLPKKLSPGAMCYYSSVRLRRTDYVCPQCGERTLYEESKLEDIKYSRDNVCIIIGEDIPGCHRELAKIRKIVGDAMALDESQFCRKCSPKVTEPKLVLHITYEDGTTRNAEKVTAEDLQLIREFLAGDAVHKGVRDREIPLKKSLPRLQELLGVELKK